MRKSTFVLIYFATSLLLMLGMFFHGARVRSDRAAELERKRAFVEGVGVTDLCIFTDARYARHPSMADLHTPFQDYPLSFEHFPSGSILSIPPHLRPREEPHETIR